jgi:hypothetical protein
MGVDLLSLTFIMGKTVYNSLNFSMNQNAKLDDSTLYYKTEQV